MSLFPLALPPGVVRGAVESNSEGRWAETHLTRWDPLRKALAPVGGWQEHAPDAPDLDGTCRSILPWWDNSDDRWIALGTSQHLYIMGLDGTVYDITPLRDTNSLGSNPIATTNGSNTITVTDTAHGASVGDTVTLSGATAVGGLTTDQLNASFVILTTPDANTWTAEVAGDAATSTTTGGGSSITAKYQIGPGDDDVTYYSGFGAGLFGAGLFGADQTDTSSLVPASAWHLDTWGQNLLALRIDDGALYEWGLSTSTPAAVVSNAPTGCLGMVVTPESMVLLLAPDGNRRKVQWSDQEDNTEWTPSATTRAGDFELQSQGSLVCARAVKNATLILTDADAHLMTDAGYPLIYGFRRLGVGCGVVSPMAVAVMDDQALWMGPGGFWRFNGGYVAPLPCDIDVYSDLNRSRLSKAFAVHLAEQCEVWFLFPSGDSTEVDRYVAFNYRDGYWHEGALARTAAAPSGVFMTPLMVGAGRVYEHETGFGYDGADMPFAVSGPIMLGAGERRMLVNRYIPDDRTAGDVNVSFFARNWPNDAAVTKGPFTRSSPTNLRFQARRIQVRVDALQGSDWRVGTDFLDVVPGDPR